MILSGERLDFISNRRDHPAAMGLVLVIIVLCCCGFTLFRVVRLLIFVFVVLPLLVFLFAMWMTKMPLMG